MDRRQGGGGVKWCSWRAWKGEWGQGGGGSDGRRPFKLVRLRWGTGGEEWQRGGRHERGGDVGRWSAWHNAEQARAGSLTRGPCYSPGGDGLNFISNSNEFKLLQNLLNFE
jgi:hypothetical protein